jgi:acetyl-CoA carboxylase biotin carboxylase subunit
MTTARRRLRRILVANRGEIAVRIIRASRELGLEAIQAYSEADRDSLAVQMADESICIGPPPSSQSYLKGDVVIGAARAAKADAIHPGYGFLSENAAFAPACEDANIAFIGPPARAIALMGDKATARQMAARAGVPITPGSPGTVADAKTARETAALIGYPVLLKAAAGGGGL